jgi:excisionase family DNA binding protein
METENLLTIEDAAAQIGVTVSAIRNATLEGRLPFVRLFGRKLIQADALAEYKARTQVDGVPPRGRPARRPLSPVASDRPSPSEGRG